MSLPAYTQAFFKKCSIDNIDISLHVRQLHVSTSILTPYITAKITIADTSNVQDALLGSGLPVSIVYSAGDSSTIREYELVTMGDMGGVKDVNNRVGKLEITAVSKHFFDMQSEHTSYHQNVPTSEVFRKLHKELVPGTDVNVTKTRGLVGDIEAFRLTNMKMGRAINYVRNRMTDEKYQSGSYVYYVDQDSNFHCVPILELFDKAAGPKFTQRVAGLSFIKEQDTLAYNIFSMKRGSTKSGYGSDNAINYQSLLKQRGGAGKPGWDWASASYSPITVKDYDSTSLATPGKTIWSGSKPTTPGTVNHGFNYDSNQKISPDFEADVANAKFIQSMILQGSTLINVPLEGGLKSYVGKGCYLDIPSNVGDGSYNRSLYAGQHLVVAQGEYIFQDQNGVMGVAAIQTSSGGKQGSMV